MAKYYKINIVLIEDVPGTENEYKKTADTGNEKDGGAVYAYVKRELVIQRKSEVLSMELDQLDIKKVISAMILSN